MGQLVVRNLGDDVVDALKARAAEHGRSAEAEHRDLLRRVLLQPGEARDDWFERARALRDRLGRLEGRSTTDILRADRDRTD